MSEFPKFQISKFVGKSRDYQVVLRTDDLEELTDAMSSIKPLIKELEEFVGEKVVEQAGSKQNGDWCDYHQVPMRRNKNNKLYHLDNTREEGDQFCNGRGFPKEFKEWKESRN